MSTKRPQGDALDPVTKLGRLAAIAAAVITLLPLPVVFLVSISENWTQGPMAGVTFEWLTQAWNRMGGAIEVSLRIAAIVLVVNLVSDCRRSAD